MTLSPFMMSFDSRTVTRQAILDFLDTRPEIMNWFAPMPNTIIIVSNSGVNQICDAIRERFGSSLTFIVSKMNPTENNGFVNKDVWLFLNNPKSSGRWPDGE